MPGPGMKKPPEGGWRVGWGYSLRRSKLSRRISEIQNAMRNVLLLCELHNSREKRRVFWEA